MIMVGNRSSYYEVVAMMMFATIGIRSTLVLNNLLVQVLRVPLSGDRGDHFRAEVVGASRSGAACSMSGDARFRPHRLRDALVQLPMARLLGIVLGDLMEKNLRRGLILSDGSSRRSSRGQSRR